MEKIRAHAGGGMSSFPGCYIRQEQFAASTRCQSVGVTRAGMASFGEQDAYGRAGPAKDLVVAELRHASRAVVRRRCRAGSGHAGLRAEYIHLQQLRCA